MMLSKDDSFYPGPELAKSVRSDDTKYRSALGRLVRVVANRMKGRIMEVDTSSFSGYSRDSTNQLELAAYLLTDDETKLSQLNDELELLKEERDVLKETIRELQEELQIVTSLQERKLRSRQSLSSETSTLVREEFKF